MSYLSESLLRSQPPPEKRAQTFASAAPSARITAFLSHSHGDQDLALRFVELLRQHGVDLYVDWTDTTMPPTTNRETARRIRDEIARRNIFFALLTARAVSSRWVPWEIGIADQAKSHDRLLLVPIVDPSGNFDGAEYLQLYRSVEQVGGSGMDVVGPGAGYVNSLARYIAGL